MISHSKKQLQVFVPQIIYTSCTTLVIKEEEVDFPKHLVAIRQEMRRLLLVQVPYEPCRYMNSGVTVSLNNRYKRELGLFAKIVIH